MLGGACIEMGEDELPYAPLVAALRPLQRAGDPVLAELPDSTRAELARLIPELGEVPGEPETERGEAQRRLFDAFLELIASLGAEQPVLLWIEDIHWADRSTRSFLRFLEASLTKEPAVVVATYRSDELHRRHPLRPLLAELERSPCAERVELERFDRDELADQLADILGSAPDREVVDRMYGRSEGNPLFTEELLAAGVDARAALPPSLREALLLRVERLPADSQQLLRLLAVSGRTSHELLADGAGVAPAELSVSVREAITAQIVVVDDTGRYTFRHALLREVLYDDLLPGERSELHLTAAHALERAAAGGDGAWTATGVAHHYYSAGDQPRAFSAALAAARAVQRVHAYGEAAGLLDRALELWPRVPDPERLADADHAEVLTRAGRAHYLAGDEEMGAALYETAVEEIDERGRARAGRARCSPRSRPASGRSASPSAAGRRSAAGWSWYPPTRTPRPGPSCSPSGCGSCSSRAASATCATRRLRRSRRRSGRGSDPIPGSSTASAARCSHSATRRVRGRGSTSRSSSPSRKGTSDNIATAYLNYADALHIAGQSREGREVAERGMAEVSRRIGGSGASRSLRWIRLNLAEIEFDLGDWEEADKQLAPAGTPYRGVALAHALLRRSQLSLGRGEHDEARQALDQADQLLANALEPQYIALLAAMRAELEQRGGDLDAAAREVDRGIDRIQFCSDDGARLALVAAAGASIAADAAERADDLGDMDAADAAVARAESMVELARAAVEDGARPVEAATLASAEGDLARARGADDPQLWAAAAQAWERVDRPYPRAVARWRQAQAELARGDRDAAARSLGDAIAGAKELGAGWLLGEAEGFRARARLSLAAPGADGDEATSPEAPDPEPFGLTPRERQVLTLLASGATNREIAGELYMAEKTASVHVSRILGKLDVRSRTEAAAVAHRHGLGAGTEASRENGAERG